MPDSRTSTGQYKPLPRLEMGPRPVVQLDVRRLDRAAPPLPRRRRSVSVSSRGRKLGKVDLAPPARGSAWGPALERWVRRGSAAELLPRYLRRHALARPAPAGSPLRLGSPPSRRTLRHLWASSIRLRAGWAVSSPLFGRAAERTCCARSDLRNGSARRKLAALLRMSGTGPSGNRCLPPPTLVLQHALRATEIRADAGAAARRTSGQGSGACLCRRPFHRPAGTAGARAARGRHRRHRAGARAGALQRFRPCRLSCSSTCGATRSLAGSS